MAFLIDPTNKSITHVESPTSLDEIYRLLSEGNQIVDTVGPYRMSATNDVLLVDEEGSYKKVRHGFKILLSDYQKGTPFMLPLINKTIVVRFENEGKPDERIIETVVSLAQLQEIVEWE